MTPVADLPKERQPGYAETRDLAVPATSIARGDDVFAANCARCHGARGDGQSAASMESPTKVRNLRDAASYRFGLEERDLFRTVKYGIAGTVMQAFGGRLSDQEIWDVAAYVRSLQQKGNHATATPH